MMKAFKFINLSVMAAILVIMGYLVVRHYYSNPIKSFGTTLYITYPCPECIKVINTLSEQGKEKKRTMSRAGVDIVIVPINLEGAVLSQIIYCMPARPNDIGSKVKIVKQYIQYTQSIQKSIEKQGAPSSYKRALAFVNNIKKSNLSKRCIDKWSMKMQEWNSIESSRRKYMPILYVHRTNKTYIDGFDSALHLKGKKGGEKKGGDEKEDVSQDKGKKDTNHDKGNHDKGNHDKGH